MPAKLDRCVRKVRKYLRTHGKTGNPWAICKASLGIGGRVKPTKWGKKKLWK